MAQLDLDLIKEIPGYKLIVKSVLKCQIQQLVDQLSTYTDEESVILTANLADGTLSHLGSSYGKFFLENDESMKSQFLKFCIKVHQVKEKEKAEHLMKKQSIPSPLVLQLSSPSLSEKTSKPSKPHPGRRDHPHSGTMFKSSPKARGKGTGRYEPYQKMPPKPADEKSDLVHVKNEPGSIDGNDESNGATIGHSAYQFGLEDDAKSNSSASTISNDPREFLSKDVQFRDVYDSSANSNLEDISKQLDKNDSRGDLSETDRVTPRIKVEPPEEDETELEIIGMEPGLSSVPPKNWASGIGSGIDQSGAGTSGMTDMKGYITNPMDEGEMEGKEMEDEEEMMPKGSFSDNTSIKKFKKKFDKEGELQSSVCASDSMQEENIKEHTDGEKEFYECSICNCCFNNKKAFDEHREEHNEMDYHCIYCGKRFKTTESLKVHMIIHDDDQTVVLKCPYDSCKKSFLNRSTYEEHINSHIGMYTCFKCGRMFRGRANKDMHVRTCTDSGNFRCEFCNQGYSNAQALKRHKDAQHFLKKHVCSCGMSYRYQSSLVKHQRKNLH